MEDVRRACAFFSSAILLVNRVPFRFFASGAFICCCLLATGCRTNPDMVLLERENRLLQDENYRLKNRLNEFEDASVSTISESPTSMRDSAADDEPRRSSSSSRAKPLGGRGKKTADDPQLETPTIEMPSGEKPTSDLPDTLRRPVGERPSVRPGRDSQSPAPDDGGASYRAPNGPRFPGVASVYQENDSTFRRVSATEPAMRNPRLVNSRETAAVTLNRDATGGYDADGRPGDDGVVVALEPRDAKGNRIDAPASVNVAVIDPTLPGDEARVARWDFLPEQTAQMFRGDGVGRSMYVQAAWPKQPPKHRQLNLHVRYVTSDGRKFEVKQAITVALPGEKVARWRASERESGSSDRMRDSEVSATSHEQASEEVRTSAVAIPSTNASSDRYERMAAREKAKTDPQEETKSNGDDEGGLKRPVWSPER